MWEILAGNLPHLTAVLNLTATVLLLMRGFHESRRNLRLLEKIILKFYSCGGSLVLSIWTLHCSECVLHFDTLLMSKPSKTPLGLFDSASFPVT